MSDGKIHNQRPHDPGILSRFYGSDLVNEANPTPWCAASEGNTEHWEPQHHDDHIERGEMDYRHESECHRVGKSNIISGEIRRVWQQEIMKKIMRAGRLVAMLFKLVASPFCEFGSFVMLIPLRRVWGAGV